MKPAHKKVRKVAIVVAAVLCGWGIAKVIAHVRENGRRAQCGNNLRQIGLALIQYSTLKGVFPCGTTGGADLPPERRLSWFIPLSPYYDYAGLGVHFQLNRPWDAPENLRPRATSGSVGGSDEEIDSFELTYLGISRCPSKPRGDSYEQRISTSFVGIAGVGTDAPRLPLGHPRAGVFGYDRQTRPEAITDGLSTTLLLVETALNNGPWTAGGPSTVRGLDPDRLPYIGRQRQFGGLHPGGVNVAFADGSVRFVSATIAPRMFEALCTVSGGESLPFGWEK